MIAAQKPKFPRQAAIEVARQLHAWLGPSCDRVIFAGSLRRRKQFVGDIEILYIPKFETAPDGLFDTKQLNLSDQAIDRLLSIGAIQKRPNTLGHDSWGQKNKLALHTETGIPIDLFAATARNWWNYLVCRTGGAENNVRIAAAAQSKGWKWHPYNAGFTDQHGNLVSVTSEEDVFRHVGLPYLQPWER
jgi:DNA polymerase (family 10)